ncbi:TetR/AcrR family transcriptional regulator [Actinocatenispora sera]|nr:TetR/AcrR family transcriptional regulator [Actinocatenispora sera]
MTEIPAPPWRTGKRPVRQPLSQDAIVAAATRVLDAEGLDAVSMRRVAQELGTGPASLYAHVANKDELYELMLDSVVGETVEDAERAVRESDWQQGARRIARAGRDALRRHRDLARVAMTGFPFAPNSMRVTEAYLAILRGAGLPDQIVAWAVDRLALYVTADVLEGAYYYAKGWKTEEQAHAYFEQAAEYLRTLPPERFPNTVAMVDALVSGGSDERFEQGLDMILDGVAKYLP